MVQSGLKWFEMGQNWSKCGKVQGKLAKDGFSKKIHAIRNSRCKNLTDEQIEEILLDVEREVETCLTSRMPKYNAFTRTPKVEKLRKQGYKKREFSETIQEEWK